MLPLRLSPFSPTLQLHDPENTILLWACFRSYIVLSRDIAAVVTVFAFLLPYVLSISDVKHGVHDYLRALSWAAFTVFWIFVLPSFVSSRSFLEVTLILVAIPLCLKLSWGAATATNATDAPLHRAVASIGGVYMIFFLTPAVGPIPSVEQVIVEHVTSQTVFFLNQLGFTPAIEQGPNTYASQIVFYPPSAPPLVTHIEVACTGIGSIAIILGLGLATHPNRKQCVFLVGLSILVYVLNLLRNIFIAAAFGGQWLQISPELVLTLTGYSDPRLVSFFIADKVIGQTASLLVLCALLIPMLRVIPAIKEPLDAAYAELGR